MFSESSILVVHPICIFYFVSMKKDLNQLAKSIVDEAIQGKSSTKNANAVALGRLGGLKGGKARAKKLSKERRSEIAKNAAKTRWNKKD